MHQHNIISTMLQRARCLKRELLRGIRQINGSTAQKTKERWQGMRMHWQLPCNLDENLVRNEQPYRWLKFGDIKEKTEITIVTAQNQAIRINYLKNTIFKEEIDSKCQLCKQQEETIDHLTTGCPILVKNDFWMRHDKVCAHLHYQICKALGAEMTDTHIQTSMWTWSFACYRIKRYTQREKLQQAWNSLLC